jgi:hypothetical protein
MKRRYDTFNCGTADTEDGTALLRRRRGHVTPAPRRAPSYTRGLRKQGADRAGWTNQGTSHYQSGVQGWPPLSLTALSAAATDPITLLRPRSRLFPAKKKRICGRI